ncbi:MAG: hypothetical protein KatS3mg129_1272 [Leptospiraceae bacterium]|nr:MAG: hypothetical protein KatS3mg129_1272 [Leptospiraceae bacterium]
MLYKRKYFFLTIFYLISIIILTYILYTNHHLRTVQFYLLLDIGFLIAFYIKYRKNETYLFYLRLFYYFLFINHITLLSFIIVQFKGVKFHYDILFQFLFLIFLFLTSKKNLEYVNFLLLFLLLVPPIAIIIDHYYFSEYIFILFFIIYLELTLTKNYFLIALSRKSNVIYLFYLILLITGVIQFFYVFSKSSILFHLFRFFLYILSFFPILYFIRSKKKENLYNILYIISVYTLIQLFMIVFLISFNHKNIIGKANENFFAMYFDWAIFIMLFSLFYIKENIIKRILIYLFIFITFLLTYYAIFLFGARTTEYIIPITILFYFNKVFNG